MEKKGLLYRSLLFLTLIFALSFGQLLFAAQMGYTVNAEEAADDTAGASEEGEDDGEYTYLLGEQYQNLPVEPIVREANNMLLAGGLVVFLAAVGGAVVIDRRKE